MEATRGPSKPAFRLPISSYKRLGSIKNLNGRASFGSNTNEISGGGSPPSPWPRRVFAVKAEIAGPANMNFKDIVLLKDTGQSETTLFLPGIRKKKFPKGKMARGGDR